jgi:hypothetical protein
MSFGGCIGEMPAIAAAAGCAVGLACGIVPAATEIFVARRPAGAAARWVATIVFVMLGAVPWGPAWRAISPQPGFADTVAWWVAVIAFGVAAALLRGHWPRAGALVVASTIAVGGWQGYGFRGGCGGDDPIYSGVGFAIGAMVTWRVALMIASRMR